MDNTPPDTQITGGPTGQISVTDVTFTFTGTDNLTPVDILRFAWRLDGGAWSEFQTATTASVTNLAPGPHTFEVKARDLAGNEDPTPAQATFTVGAGVSVTITSPADGTTVPTGMLLVTGTVDAGGAEVGVAVNSVPAAVQGNAFAAVVPVTADMTVLTATAITPDGASASHRVTVAVSAPPEPSSLTGALVVAPDSGIAPLVARFSLSGATPTAIALDADGDGTPDFQGPSLEGQTFTYAQAGLYVARATLTDAEGRQSTVSAVVNVLERAQMDALLKAKWNAMKAALTRNDIEGALAFFTPPARDRFRALFALVGARIAQIAADMQDIELVYVLDGRAKYRLPRTQLYAGQLTTLTYYVYFVQDDAGLWSVESF